MKNDMPGPSHDRPRTPPTSTLIWGLIFGIVFGFLLQKGGLAKYDVIIGQLLLRDFTVLKVMLSAVLTGMVGIYILKHFRLIELQPKPGSLVMNVVGGTFFGVGFAVLGYCPGTLAVAIGTGHLDALAGMAGVIIGAGMFAGVYGKLRDTVLWKGKYRETTFPRLINVNEWVVVIPLGLAIFLALWLLR